MQNEHLCFPTPSRFCVFFFIYDWYFLCLNVTVLYILGFLGLHKSVSRSMTGGKHSQLASASLLANVSPGSACGSNQSTEHRFVIQVKVGRSSGSDGQLE